MADELVLVVEDSDEDVEAISRAIGRSHPDMRLEFVRSGAEVLPRLADPAARRPDLMLLDLNLPGESGHDVLRDIRRQAAYDGMTIIVFTSSTTPSEVDECLAMGADSYVYKPVNFALFQTVLRGALDYWRGQRSP
jgi:CheY-like chemotaxis protein